MRQTVREGFFSGPVVTDPSNAVTNANMREYEEECSVGYYCLGGVANDCGAGSYQDTKGASECKAADKGHYVDPNDATQQVECEPGRYSDRTAQMRCFDCGVGMYQSLSGATACDICAACAPSMRLDCVAINVDTTSCVCRLSNEHVSGGVHAECVPTHS